MKKKSKPKPDPPDPDDRDVIKALRRSGAELELEKRRVKSAMLNGQEVTAEQLKLLSQLVDLRWLYCAHAQIKDSDLRTIGRFGSLEILALNYTSVSDKGIRHLRRLKNLRSIGLIETNVTDDGVKALTKSIPELEVTRINPLLQKQTEDAAVRCPVAQCCGWVSLVDEDEACWGCGECGSVWRDRKNLSAEITAIVKMYPYRRKCYRKAGKHWKANDINKEVQDYDERVENEEPDDADSYERG